MTSFIFMSALRMFSGSNGNLREQQLQQQQHVFAAARRNRGSGG